MDCIDDSNNFFYGDDSLRKTMELYEDIGLFKRLRLVAIGLGEPSDSGKHKWAVLEVKRMTAPFISIMAVLAFLVILMLMPSSDSESRTQIAEVVVPETVEDLDDTPEVDQIEIDEVEFDPIEVSDVSVSVVDPTPVSTPLSPKPASFNAVLNNYKSPVTMKGVMGGRTSGQIGASRKKYNGSLENEICVLRALRWLKTKQNPDGSWPSTKPAMTGLALLTFLAHGELPGISDEFGDTVRRGIQYLLDSQDANGYFKGHDGNNYSHLIATYALCEAFSMTQNPSVKESAERALVHIVNGQHPNGGWDYKMAQTERDDTSYMGWAAQAVKAGKLAGLDVPRLDEVFNKIPTGFNVNFHKDGGFGYTGPSHNSGLTAVGTLCVQLTKQVLEEESTSLIGNKKMQEMIGKSLAIMDNWTLGWEPDKNDLTTKPIPSNLGTGANQQYYAYYASQCAFQAGKSRWDRWNKMMSDIYPKVQKIQSKETSGYVDHKGKPQELGHWENGDVNKDSGPFVMDTCLTALQLEVYYRYLPTFKEVKIEDAEVVQKNDDIPIEIELFN